MQKISKNRWKINKIGLMNYWWYDEEEFHFEDGRMILRGTNGSGKSVTMQSFIPLLLDGKKTPERLDPFGNKARKIEDYVLGYGDSIKEENTSYLYMEFYRQDLGAYKTIGMGLRGKKGQGVKFWGFVVKDGRRIGKDLLLYKDKSQKIPLSKLELKNRLGEGGEIVETQKEYASLVNHHIFGFETLEEYDEFIKLLIEIRTPKLSDGKGFKPSTIIEILSNSLRPLSDEDLRTVSESLDNMNQTKEQLFFLKKSKKAIDKIKIYYDEYNQYLLYIKAKVYQTEEKNERDCKIEKESLEKKIRAEEEQLSSIREQIQELEAKIIAIQLQEETLRNSKAWNLQRELEQIEESLKELVKKIAEKDKRIDEEEKAQKRKENEVNVAKEEYEKQEGEFLALASQLEEKAKEIDYHEYFFVIDEIKENLTKKYSLESLQKDLKRYIEKIEEARKSLQLLKEAEREYDQVETELEVIRNQKVKQDAKVTKLRMEREEEKIKMSDDMYRWEASNQIFKIADEEKTAIFQKIEKYGEGTTYDDILMSVRNPFYRIQNQYEKEVLAIRYEKEELTEKIEGKKEEKKEWENKKEPEPVREEIVIQNRENLRKANIPFLPFYQTIDFKKEVDETTKGIIESALKDMGILDALVIPEEQLNKAMNLDAKFVDKYLISNPMELRHDLTEYLQVSLPEGISIVPEQIVNILKTILIADQSAQNYLDESGFYQIGLLRGKTSKVEESKWIGQESKRRYRQKKILELEQEIKSLEQEWEEKEQEKKILEEKMNQLKEEFELFPKKDKLEEYDNQFQIARNQLEAIKLEISRKEESLKEKYEILKQTKLDSEEKTLKLKFPAKLETYEQIEKTAKELKEDLFLVENKQNNLVNIFERQRILQENLERIEETLDELRYDWNQFSFKQKQEEEKRHSIQEVLQKEGNQLAAQMEECLRLKRELPRKKEEAKKQEGVLETSLQNQKELLVKVEQKGISSFKRKEVAEDIFRQEYQLGYVMPKESQEKTLNDLEIAKEVMKTYHFYEKQGKDKSAYLDNLMIHVRENQEYLVDYNLSIDTILENNEEEKEEQESEIIGLLRTRSRKDLRCFVNGRKVNFYTLEKEVAETISNTEALIEEGDRRLFEEILTNTVGRKIRERIYHAKDWVKAMNTLMESIDTSSKLSFSLNWKPKVASDDSEMDTVELVDLLNTDSRILRQDQIKKVANHFRTKFAKAEEKVKEMGGVTSFHDMMKEALDYRTWFEFKLYYKKGIDTKKELTNHAFFKLSGGEKAMAMYIPLFAAVTSKFQSAKETTPRIISLDEAFAGVDDANIRDMFRILTKLELEYIINSQVLWGEYDTIPSLAINELVSDPELKVVTIIRYIWNGQKRELMV